MVGSKGAYDQQFIDELRAARIQPRGTLDLATKRPLSEQANAIAALVTRVNHIATSGGGLTSRDLERAIGLNDLVPVNYLERGLLAARSVCRIAIRTPFGSGYDWGTGFLIAPNLLLTNHHVIGSAEEASRATAEFGFERDAIGNFRVSRRFSLGPDQAFLTDEALDFTLVAVADVSEEGEASLSEYGFLRLNQQTHKVETGEFVSIIQHPGDAEKFVALRENRVIKIGDNNPARNQLLWYYSDTAPGSSGAPVFNDSWQVVAIHHRGVPDERERERDGIVEWQLVTGDWIAKAIASQFADEKVKWIANEGVRTSHIVASIIRRHDANLPGSRLIQAFLDDINDVRSLTSTPGREAIVGPPLSPLITTPAGLERGQTVRSDVRPIESYAGRTGFDHHFLTTLIGLPELTPQALEFGAVARVGGKDDLELRYTHFSIVFNATRRLAFFTAVNIDGTESRGLDRETDAWFFDPRLPRAMQAGNEVYGNEPSQVGPKGWFDRGHLVRRLDPVWGPLAIATLANEDTFHWTNCSPQYWAFNQGQELWQGLENFILYNTDEENVRANVFTGPVFQDDDEEHRGVRVPQHFWKVVVVRDRNGTLYSSAYVVSQREYARDIPFELLPVGAHSHFQVSVASLEARTGLRFAAKVRNADEGQDLVIDRPLRSLGDIQHRRR